MPSRAVQPRCVRAFWEFVLERPPGASAVLTARELSEAVGRPKRRCAY